MTQREAKQILSVYRPGSADADAAEFAEALALTNRDSELRRWFEDHCSVNDAIRTRFRQFAVPQGLKEQIISEHRASNVLVWWRQPAVLAAAAALAMLLAIAALWTRSNPDIHEEENFAIYRQRMVSSVLRSYTMTLETSDLDQIRAHLAEKLGPTNYVLPAALAKSATAGCGVLSWQDKRVSMVCFRTGKPLEPGEKSDLFLFVVDRNALPDAPMTTAPVIAQVNKLVTASWSVGDKTYLLATPGDEPFIRRYFDEASPPL